MKIPPLYYHFEVDYVRGGAPGFEIVNYMTIQKNKKGISPSPPWLGGINAGADAGPWRFPEFVETPRLLFDKKLGRTPRDLECIDFFWAVSAKMKTFLETIDPGACQFRECISFLRNGEPGPKYWLCSITRAFANGIDFNASEGLSSTFSPSGATIYSASTLASKIIFLNDVVRESKLFHIIELMPKYVYCHVDVKTEFKKQGLTGARFWNI